MEHWDRDQVTELIELWMTKDCLFDTTSKNYRDKRSRKRSLEEISAALGVQDAEILKKMKNLRSQYTRELTKEANSAEQYTSHWAHMTNLKFLQPFLLPQKNRTNANMGNLENMDFFTINENSFDGEEGTNEEYDSFDPPTPLGQLIKSEPALTSTLPASSASSVQSHEGRESRPRPAKRQKYDQNDAVWIIADQEKHQPPQKQTPEPENKAKAIEDEFDIFGKHVAAELRCIDNVNSYRLAKLQIQQILFLAQTGHDMLPMSSTQWVPAAQNPSVTNSGK